MAFCLHLSSFPCTYTGSSRLPPGLYRRRSGVQGAHRAQCCAATTSLPSQPLRRSANYPPSLWDDDHVQSLGSDFMKEEHASQVWSLKEDVRRLIGEEKEIVDQLELIDALRQLGVAYHFEKEIKDAFATISRLVVSISMEDDLYGISLLFRLLREHGFYVSQDVFNSFKDERGSFKAYLCNDIKGMLSLYEASFLGMEGEIQLYEARAFTTKHLSDLTESIVEPSLKEHVAHALELPLHWRLSRLHSRWFIELYEREDNMNPTLLKLAKLDFNMVQSTYKRELKEASRWWTNLGLLREKLYFARDRLVENYLWAVGFAFEPRFWRFREAVTKAICLITTIDDVYDVYGSLDELELFTDAVDRWEASAIEVLPDYMKICFLALFNTTNDTAYKVLDLKGVDIIPFLKRAWADLCKAFLVEAKWYHSGYMPTLEEYLDNAWVSISGPVILTHAYCTSEDITEEALEHFKCYPDIVRHSSLILRLSDDLATSTAELERGDVPKSIQCYMHEKRVSEAKAREHIREMISSTWKELNGDHIAMSSFEESFKTVGINLPRMGQWIYQYRDGYGEPGNETKDGVISLLIEPIPL